MVAWRVAKSLSTLLHQVNTAFPNRAKQNDGTIGDTSHQARTSDHNPNNAGVVCAMDITHDPKHGCDSYALAEMLRQNKDRRIKYVISNHRIFAGADGPSPWEWRPYHGTNPHDCHVHISVKGTPALWDDTSPWGLGDFPPVAGNLTEAPSYPLLKKGATNDDVKVVQRLLAIDANGTFGEATENAVKEYQRSRGLHVDGIVGTYTWRELEKHPVTIGGDWILNIRSTMFGGKADDERSAYDGHLVTAEEFGVALPARIPEPRPQVEVRNHGDGRTVICNIVDVGPWNTDDPYWAMGNRPQAETGFDKRGRPTNKAGIDLTTAAARKIGVTGMGRVDWRFLPTTRKGLAT